MTALELHTKLVQQVKRLADNGQMTWIEAQPPNPAAVRAFEGRGHAFTILVQQGNISNAGETPHLDYHAGGMFTGEADGNPLLIVLHFTRDEANYLYHKAAAQRN